MGAVAVAGSGVTGGFDPPQPVPPHQVGYREEEEIAEMEVWEDWEEFLVGWLAFLGVDGDFGPFLEALLAEYPEGWDLNEAMEDIVRRVVARMAR